MTGLQVVAMHVIGFFSAFSISFFGHYVYTFRSRKRVSTAAARYIIVSGCALLASSVIAWLGTLAGLPGAVSLLAAAVCVPIASYVANRELVF
jgi:GtrA-like protein.